MALEKTFRQLSAWLCRLCDRLEELQVTVVEDRPAQDDAVVVDRIENTVTDLLGWVKETIAAAKKAEAATGHPVDIDQARRSLAICQEKFHLVDRGFSAGLVSYERVSDLTGFGRERRGEWPSWVASVRQGIEHCRRPLEEAGGALAECWQEIAEKVGLPSVSVRTVAIGQKIDNGEGP